MVVDKGSNEQRPARLAGPDALQSQEILIPSNLLRLLTAVSVLKISLTHRKNIQQVAQSVFDNPGVRPLSLHHVHQLPFRWLSQQEAGSSSTQQQENSTLNSGRGYAAKRVTEILFFVLNPTPGMSEGMPKLHHARYGG